MSSVNCKTFFENKTKVLQSFLVSACAKQKNVNNETMRSQCKNVFQSFSNVLSKARIVNGSNPFYLCRANSHLSICSRIV